MDASVARSPTARRRDGDHRERARRERQQDACRADAAAEPRLVAELQTERPERCARSRELAGHLAQVRVVAEQ
jgi:hypothetical protein